MGSPKSESRRIPKTHVKKKQYRQECRTLAREGKINAANGNWVNRGAMPDNSMKRDYMPNGDA